MKVYRRQARAVLLLLVVGCGTPRGGTGTQSWVDRLAGEAALSSEMVNAPADQVWSILPRVYEELGVNLSVIDSNRMWLGNTRFRLREINGERLSRFLDCGSGVGIVSYADTYQVTMALLTGISEGVEGGSEVQTHFQAVARPRAVSGNDLRCTSRGTLERRIVEIIVERVEMDSARESLTPL